MHLIHPLGGTSAHETSLLPSMAAAITSPRAAVSTAEQELDKSELDKMTDLSFFSFFFHPEEKRAKRLMPDCEVNAHTPISTSMHFSMG